MENVHLFSNLPARGAQSTDCDENGRKAQHVANDARQKAHVERSNTIEAGSDCKIKLESDDSEDEHEHG